MKRHIRLALIILFGLLLSYCGSYIILSMNGQYEIIEAGSGHVNYLWAPYGFASKRDIKDPKTEKHYYPVKWNITAMKIYLPLFWLDVKMCHPASDYKP